MLPIMYEIAQDACVDYSADADPLGSSGTCFQVLAIRRRLESNATVWKEQLPACVVALGLRLKQCADMSMQSCPTQFQKGLYMLCIYICIYYVLPPIYACGLLCVYGGYISQVSIESKFYRIWSPCSQHASR